MASIEARTVPFMYARIKSMFDPQIKPADTVRLERPSQEFQDILFTIKEPAAVPCVEGDFPALFQALDSESTMYRDFRDLGYITDKQRNLDGTINSCYGYLTFGRQSCGGKYAKHRKLTPWEWAAINLKQDRNSRKAFVRWSLPSQQWIGCKDQPGFMHGLFTITPAGSLNFSVVAREVNLVHLRHLLPWFASLIDRMLTELRMHYPELTKGTYSQFTQSLYLLTKDVADA